MSRWSKCSTVFNSSMTLPSVSFRHIARHSFIRGVYLAIPSNIPAFGRRTRIKHGVEH
jgi:hypothetical protein